MTQCRQFLPNASKSADLDPGEGEKNKSSKLTDSIILLHINDHPHVTNRTQDQLNAIQWGVFKYPAHSLDL
jgi:hypothetical protein